MCTQHPAGCCVTSSYIKPRQVLVLMSRYLLTERDHYPECSTVTGRTETRSLQSQASRFAHEDSHAHVTSLISTVTDNNKHWSDLITTTILSLHIFYPCYLCTHIVVFFLDAFLSAELLTIVPCAHESEISAATMARLRKPSPLDSSILLQQPNQGRPTRSSPRKAVRDVSYIISSDEDEENIPLRPKPSKRDLGDASSIFQDDTFYTSKSCASPSNLTLTPRKQRILRPVESNSRLLRKLSDESLASPEKRPASERRARREEWNIRDREGIWEKEEPDVREEPGTQCCGQGAKKGELED